ncbi:MAG: AMP-binding protein [Mycobacteriales bacterium]|nr:AMP-binding protein [Mycobacteriales bacterium]
MKVPFSTSDFLERGALCYGSRTGVVDEPGEAQDGGLGTQTYADLATRARAMAAGLDELGVARGERVAVVSHNSARLLESFFGVTAWGRVLVPVNFRLAPAEVGYIVEHSGATTLLIDPELDASLASITAERRFLLGKESDDALLRPGVEPAAWEPDEDATATINYTSGTTARPKGVQITHRNIWVNAVTFALHAGVSDRDVYLHTLPMFHVDGSLGVCSPQVSDVRLCA